MFKENIKQLLEGDKGSVDVLMANMIVIAVCFLSFFVPFLSFGLPILFFIYFEPSLAGFILNSQMSKTAKYENLFENIKNFIRNFCVFVVKMVVIIFYLCIFIIPGIISFLDFCFTPLILYESENLDAKGVLMLSKELVKGKRLQIFWCLIFSFFVVCAVTGIMILVVYLFGLFMIIPFNFYLIFGIIAGVLSSILFALPFTEISITSVYIASKMEKVRR